MTKTTLVNPVRIYQSLLYGILQRPRADPHSGLSLAITSANPGEGVTYTTRGLANALGEMMSAHRVVLVDLDFLQHESDSLTEIIGTSDTVDGHHILRELYCEAHANGNNGAKSQWHGSLRYRKECIRQLCSSFDFVLVDCPALRRSGEALSVAAAVDGVILVVEAGKTTKLDIAFAERQITAAGGKLEGHILNRLRHPFPKWLYGRP
jgi:Mrp family chromosome partitioning ATPase